MVFFKLPGLASGHPKISKKTHEITEQEGLAVASIVRDVVVVV